MSKFDKTKDKNELLWYDKSAILIKELCIKLLDDKMAENENFIRFIFYELRVKNNLSENETEEFLRLAMTFLENNGYEVYVGNARYTFNNNVVKELKMQEW